MKMPEKHDLLAAILAAKEQGIGAILAVGNAGTFGQMIMAVRFTKQMQSTQRCAPLSPSLFVTFDFAGLSSNLAYITSVFIGYIGTDRLVRLSNASLLKKSEQVIGRNVNNQRKAFLDMLAWSEGTDNGRQKTRNHGYDVT